MKHLLLDLLAVSATFVVGTIAWASDTPALIGQDRALMRNLQIS